MYIKRQYLEIVEDFETRSDTLNYELDKSLPREKYKKVIGFMKDELARKIITEFFELRAKTYNYLIDSSSEDKKAKGSKKCVIKT